MTPRVNGYRFLRISSKRVIATWESFSMNDNRRRFPSGRSMQRLQENLWRDEPRILASYTLVGTVVVLGGIGYGVDVWNGTSPWFLLLGLMTGITLGFVNLAKIVWRR